MATDQPKKPNFLKQFSSARVKRAEEKKALAAAAEAQKEQDILERGYTEHGAVKKQYQRQVYIVEHRSTLRNFVYIATLGVVTLIMLGVVYGIFVFLPERDSDKDGVPNALDVCPGFDDRADDDNDGIPDGCEEKPDVTDIPAQNVQFVSGVTTADVVFEMTNPMRDWGVSPLVYTVTLRDISGNIVAERERSSYLLPGETHYYGEVSLPISGKPHTAEVTVQQFYFIKVQDNFPQADFEISNLKYVTYNEPGLAARVEGTITNKSSYTFKVVEIPIIIKNERGAFVALNFTTVQELTPGEKRDFFASWPDIALEDGIVVQAYPFSNLLLNANIRETFVTSGQSVEVNR